MKNLRVNLVIAAIMLGSLSAQGVIRPGWERPIWKAELVELSLQGEDRELNGDFQTLIVHQRDEAKKPTSFSFIEGQNGVRCGVDMRCMPVRIAFFIYKIMDAGCGSVKYLAREIRRTQPDMLPPLKRLEVVDHANRLCDDYRPYRWEVGLIQPDAESDIIRLFGGNPEPVITPARVR